MNWRRFVNIQGGTEWWVVEGKPLPDPKPGDMSFKDPKAYQLHKAKMMDPYLSVVFDKEGLTSLTHEQFRQLKRWQRR